MVNKKLFSVGKAVKVGVAKIWIGIVDEKFIFNDEIRRQVEEYRTFDRVITDGEYYRISSPYESDVSAYYFQLGDQILLSAVLTDGKAIIGKKKPCRKLSVRTADPKATYRDTRTGLTVTGHIKGKDGVYAASLLVEMVAVTGKKLSQLMLDNFFFLGTMISPRVIISVVELLPLVLTLKVEGLTGI